MYTPEFRILLGEFQGLLNHDKFGILKWRVFYCIVGFALLYRILVTGESYHAVVGMETVEKG